MKFLYLLLISVLWACNEKQSSIKSRIPSDCFSKDTDHCFTLKPKPIHQYIYIPEKNFYCTLNELSNQFDLNVSVTNKPDYKNEMDNYTLRILIRDKDAVVRDTLNEPLNFMFGSAYTSPLNTRSYTTKKNVNRAVCDNDFGEIVVADFNFDGLDDFAAKHNEGGNGGPTYIYFIQDSTFHFHIDLFLTNEMIYFPVIFLPDRKLLITSVHASAIENCWRTFRYNPETKKWKVVRKTFIGS